jgi:galactose oxidase
MSGNAVMFDALAGRILTFGGSPNYEDSESVNSAALITLGAPNSSIEIVQAGQNLQYSRVFHTSVVLPDGSVFIAGGQRHGMPFDEDPSLTNRFTPERYIPRDDSFITQQPNSIVRVYHSISLLLPDATVMNGGGGLCANCSTNHYNLQVYTPPYLLMGDGLRAPRPLIQSVSPTEVGFGGQISIVTESSVATASLIRYGTTTHTVNTDQRRIPLELVPVDVNTYTVSIPDDGGIALPGYWMLFVLDSSGVPSEAATIHITL